MAQETPNVGDQGAAAGGTAALWTSLPGKSLLVQPGATLGSSSLRATIDNGASGIADDEVEAPLRSNGGFIGSRTQESLMASLSGTSTFLLPDADCGTGESIAAAARDIAHAVAQEVGVGPAADAANLAARNDGAFVGVGLARSNGLSPPSPRPAAVPQLVFPLTEDFYDDDEDDADNVGPIVGLASATLLSDLSTLGFTGSLQRLSRHAAADRQLLGDSMHSLDYSMDGGSAAGSSSFGATSGARQNSKGSDDVLEATFLSQSGGGIDAFCDGGTLRYSPRSHQGSFQGSSMGSTAGRRLEKDLRAALRGRSSSPNRARSISPNRQPSGGAAGASGGAVSNTTTICSVAAGTCRSDFDAALGKATASTAPNDGNDDGASASNTISRSIDVNSASGTDRCEAGGSGGSLGVGMSVQQKQLEAFARAVQSAEGLEGKLRGELLGLLQHVPVASDNPT